mmetsp:Transcript_43587/g.98536  ORF Transcript_43587/g.98536 Transcript_43587/m.98536 type:complete len:145 (-) Transcript_43587:136-570(-)
MVKSELRVLIRPACTRFMNDCATPPPKKSTSFFSRQGMELANTYFDTWNKHDLEGLRGLFHEDVALRDWDVEKFGANEVVEANGGIFEAVPNIQIEVLKIHESTGVVSAEILVHLNNEAKDVLKVVDIIEHSDGKITAVRAYKG